MKPRIASTLYDRIWGEHVVVPEGTSPAVLYIDRHLIHEVTSPQAFEGLRRRGLGVRRPDLALATADHSTPTINRSLETADAAGIQQVRQLESNCDEFGIRLYGMGSQRRGIVHVIGPELGFTLPGTTIVCGDSHTATHGAFGALAFGIGTSEVEHVLATQCLLERRALSFEVRFEGQLARGVTAKDMILSLIANIGVAGGVGHVVEYRGSAVRALDMEARMTICNMSIEAGARAGLIAPDDTTYEYLAGREFAPKGRDWDQAIQRWRHLRSDPDPSFARRTVVDVSQLEPMISFGTNPAMCKPIGESVPDPSVLADPSERIQLERALEYMGLKPAEPLLGQPIDVVFIGSCTNSRISDLRAAAEVLEGRKTRSGLRVLVVPGSQAVKKQAELEGLDVIFKDAGAEWRESGCSMCIAMNGDQLAPGQRAISTGNRNFEGRQGPGGRTMLASPLTAAASAVFGRVSDPRQLLSP